MNTFINIAIDSGLTRALGEVALNEIAYKAKLPVDRQSAIDNQVDELPTKQF